MKYILLLFISTCLVFSQEYLENTNQQYDNKPTELSLTKKEKEFIKNNPKIVFGTNAGWAPYVIKNADGSISGYDKEVLSLINNITGLNIELKLGNWDEIKEEAKEKKIDGISTSIYASYHEKYFNFTKPYITLQKILFTNTNDDNSYNSLDDFKGKVFAVHSANALDKDIANKIKNIKIIEFDTVQEVINAISTRKADVMLGNAGLMYKLVKLGNPYLKPSLFLNDNPTKLLFSIRKDMPELTSLINKSLDYIGEQKLLKLKQKWFSFSVKEKTEKINLTQDEFIYLKNKSFITMCVHPNWDPYKHIDKNGKQIGLVSSFISLIEKKLKKEIKPISTNSWKQSLEFVQNGKCEMIPFLNQTPQRDKYLNFTTSLYEEPEVIIARNDIDYINGLNDLNGKTIAIVKGYRTDKIITEHYPDIKIKYIKNYDEGISLVSKGKIDAVINSLFSSILLMRKSYHLDIKIAGKTKFLNIYKMGVIKNDKTLLSILTKTVDDISQKEKDAILSSWLAVKFEEKPNYDLIVQILIFSSIVLLLLLYRQYVIKKINKNLEKKVKEQVSQIIEKDTMIFQQNKLASMGEMLENIAHQWRQPLAQVNAAVMTIDDIAYGSGCLNEQMKKELNDIENATKYMSNTIDDFRKFISSSKNDDVFYVKDAIDQCLGIIAKPLERNSIELKIDIDKSLKVQGSNSEFLQVLMIVFNNAKDAIISNKIKNAQIQIKGYTAKDKIILSILDNGGGIQNDIIDKIFDPYFTTKHKSKGTGLGLYISKMIIEGKLNGKLSIKNIEEGACVFIEFDEYKGKN